MPFKRAFSASAIALTLAFSASTSALFASRSMAFPALRASFSARFCTSIMSRHAVLDATFAALKTSSEWSWVWTTVIAAFQSAIASASKVSLSVMWRAPAPPMRCFGGRVFLANSSDRRRPFSASISCLDA
ncbi:hypothetical protein C8J57DRAFT_1404519 [Mycena rebaudengoi]|nr:hypothetical protein C8J57DRAFT_1404519 [Mycena rebaudengoi]